MSNDVSNSSGVYKIENNINGKVYIGSSTNMRKRKNNHFSALRYDRASNSHLQNAFNKYGEDKFTFKIIEKCTGGVDKLRKREKYWIREYNATNREYGYNFRDDPTINQGVPKSEATRQKISKTKKGVSINYTMTDEERAWRAKRCKEFRPGDHMTEEQNEKRLEHLREAIVGKPISEAHKEAISKHNSGAGNGRAKLSKSDVILIKYELENSDKTHKEIAEQFNVGRSGISSISRGERWMKTDYDTMDDLVAAVEKKVSFG